MTEIKKSGRTLRTRAKPFTSVPLELITADTAMIKSTGEEVKITDTIVRVYIYMRNRYCLSLDDPKGLGYFEGWEGIAAAIGKSKDLFKKGNNRPDTILIKLGLLEIHKLGRGRSDSKVVKDIEDIKEAVVFLNSKSSDYKERKKVEYEAYKSGTKHESSMERKSEVTTPAEDPKYEIPPVEIYEDLPPESLQEDTGGNEYWDFLDECPF